MKERKASAHENHNTHHVDAPVEDKPAVPAKPIPAPEPKVEKVKAKVTWLGGPGEPDENSWNGVVFKRGEAVEVTDPHMIAKAKANRFYSVA